MNLTLHVTNRCNLRCKYCFVPHGKCRMTFDIAMRAIRLAMKDGSPTGILFYGGEPMLERELIVQLVAETEKIKAETGHQFQYKMTTNGTLLDEEFLQLAQRVNLTIGLSHDGLAQDDNRLFADGRGSFAVLEEKIDLLLQYQPYAIGLSVVDPSTVHKAAETVDFLYKKGFKYITVGMNYDRLAPWDNEKMHLLLSEYRKMTQMYREWTKAEEKIYLSTVDMKILSHLKGADYNLDRRLMSKNQITVGPDGKLYSLSRYIDKPEFEIGDVWRGIDEAKRETIFAMGSTPMEACQQCAIRNRCNYVYDSIKLVNGNVETDISPVQCAHERLVTPIVDEMAEALYKEQNAMFLHKHYNELYPVMSLIEDSL